jgi:hypothetical protein
VLAGPAAHPDRRDHDWPDLGHDRRRADLLPLGTGPADTLRQTAELTKAQRDLLAKLKIAHPRKIIEATPARA